jgi:hypothetical protein
VNNDPVNWVDPWGLSASEKGYKTGDRIPVLDQSGRKVGEIEVLKYESIDYGVEIALTYKDIGSGLTNYDFLQTITTTMPGEEKTSPYVDVADGEVGPFYTRVSEYDRHVTEAKKIGANMIVGDRPGRAYNPTGVWSGELSLMGKDAEGNYREMITFGYGFIRDFEETPVMPLVEREPSEDHRKNFPSPEE